MQITNLKHFATTWCFAAIETISNQDINAKTLVILREYVAVAEHCSYSEQFNPDYFPRWILEEMLKDACKEPKKYLDVIKEIISLLSIRGE